MAMSRIKLQKNEVQGVINELYELYLAQKVIIITLLIGIAALTFVFCWVSVENTKNALCGDDAQCRFLLENDPYAFERIYK